MKLPSKFVSLVAVSIGLAASLLSGCGEEKPKAPDAVGTGTVQIYGHPASAALSYRKGVLESTAVPDEVCVEAEGVKLSFFGKLDDKGVFFSTTAPVCRIPEIGAERAGCYFKVEGSTVAFLSGQEDMVQLFLPTKK